MAVPMALEIKQPVIDSMAAFTAGLEAADNALRFHG